MATFPNDLVILRWLYAMIFQPSISFKVATHKKLSHYNRHAIHPSFGQMKEERIKANITFKQKSYQSLLYIAAAWEAIGQGIYMEDKLIVLNKLMLDCELNGTDS